MEELKIKPEFLEEWKKCVAMNCVDLYSFAAIHAAIKGMDVLNDENKTCKEAEDAWKDCDLTGFLAGCASNMMAKFHVRGEEWRNYWNEKFGAKDAKGTVNPAIFTINTTQPQEPA